jgi:tetratricopeptide (TPR) repeat protein
MKTTHSDDPRHADSDSGLGLLLGVAAGRLVKDDNPAAFADWFAMAAPALMPELFGKAADPAQFARVMARGLYGLTPLPRHGYVPQRLPQPGRNEPCFCGSGRKYKHCCEQFDSRMPFPEVNMLRYVLDASPRDAYAALPASRVRIDAVADTAHQWRDEGRERDVAALLEPWFAGDGPLHGRLDVLFDTLMDAYLQLGKPRKRKVLIETALARGDRQLQCAAWQRRAVMASDQGQHEAALDAFREAQRLNPDDPSLTHLEVTLLIGAGRLQQARERARFWLARSQRDRDFPPPLLDLLRRAAQDPAEAILDIEERRVPALAPLRALLRKLPAPEVHYDLDLDADGVGHLRPKPALARAGAKWRKHFAQAKPSLTVLGEDNAIAFFHSEKWLPLLEREPLMWQSFDVLDDLAMAVQGLGLLGVEHAVVLPLLDRAVALLRLHVDAGRARHLPWGFLENRAALRSLAARVHHALDEDDRDTALRLAQWLVLELNPNDNHGLRGPLMRLYVQSGRYDDAIALALRYPDDFAELTLTHVLALYCAGRIDEAAAALRTAAVEHTRAVKTLLAEQARQPKSGGFGIAIGGAEEAWLYREAHRELWRERGALSWAADVLAQWRPRRRRGGKTDRERLAQPDAQIELPLSKDS